MVNKKWFKPRKYGYGATPITWEGWALTVGFIAYAIYTMGDGISPMDLVAIVVFIFLVKVKTDGKWKWSWG